MTPADDVDVDHLADELLADLDTTQARRWTFEAGAAIARTRATGRCEACGLQADNQTHHRQPRGMGGVSGEGLAVNRPCCLIRVCTTCHARIESSREWARRRGLLVPRPTDPALVPVRLRTVNGAGWFQLTVDGCYRWRDLPDDWSALAWDALEPLAA